MLIHSILKTFQILEHKFCTTVPRMRKLFSVVLVVYFYVIYAHSRLTFSIYCKIQVYRIWNKIFGRRAQSAHH